MAQPSHVITLIGFGEAGGILGTDLAQRSSFAWKPQTDILEDSEHAHRHDRTWDMPDP